MTPRKPPQRTAKPNPPVEAALDWIRKALTLEVSEMGEAAIGELAEVLHAIAVNWNVPIEALILWIHTDAPIDGIGGEFRRWCQRYRAERAENAPEHWPE